MNHDKHESDWKLETMRKLSLSILLIGVSLVLIASLRSPIFAQRGGTAASGGSLTRDHSSADSRKNSISPEQQYKDPAALLKLDYDKVLSDFSLSRTTAHPPSMKNVMLIHLVARELAGGDTQTTARLVAGVATGRKLDQAIQQVFNLPAETARTHLRAAEKQLKSAEEQAKTKQRR